MLKYRAFSMVIEWFGHACFRVNAKPGPNTEVAVVFDPYDSKIGLKLPRVTADIVAVTHDHHDHNNVAGVSGDPFVIQGPGEYEVKSLFLYGIPSWHDDTAGADRGANTIYLLESEGLSLAHLGDLGQTEVTTEQLEHLEGVDILFVPVGGTYTLNAKQAAAIVSQIEPRLIIPMHYQMPGLKLSKPLDGVEKFVHEMGLKAETVDKLKITQATLPQEETKLVVLTF